MIDNLTPARLDTTRLQEIKSLEQEMGKVLVALDPGPSPAELTTEQLEKLRAAEQRLGVVMVAYDA